MSNNSIYTDAFYEGNGVFGKIGMPLGLGMALAGNSSAMNAFSAMSDEKKRQVIEGAKRMKSKEEMREYVNMLPDTSVIG